MCVYVCVCVLVAFNSLRFCLISCWGQHVSQKGNALHVPYFTGLWFFFFFVSFFVALYAIDVWSILWTFHAIFWSDLEARSRSRIALFCYHFWRLCSALFFHYFSSISERLGTSKMRFSHGRGAFFWGFALSFVKDNMLSKNVSKNDRFWGPNSDQNVTKID